MRTLSVGLLTGPNREAGLPRVPFLGLVTHCLISVEFEPSSVVAFYIEGNRNPYGKDSLPSGTVLNCGSDHHAAEGDGLAIETTIHAAFA